MRILLSNDDGVSGPGLAALRGAVGDMGEITIVAPDGPRSAAGHGITLHHPLTVQDVHVGGAEKYDAISVDGSPADCVRLAIHSLLDEPPDLVLTGINAGANVGINVFYSGTVAAAAEAVMLGVRGVAFSLGVTDGEVDFARAGRLSRWVLDRLLEHGLGERELVNVNIPELSEGNPRGVRVVPQSTAGVEEFYDRHIALDGSKAYKLTADYTFNHVPGETDVDALMEGYITVTPLHVDMTRHDRIETLSHCKWGEMPS